MIKDFEHVSVSVINIKKSVQFYTEVMGMEIDYKAHHVGDRISKVVNVDNAELNVCVMRKGSFKLELIDYGSEEKKEFSYKDQDSPGLIHIAFRVSDVDEEYNKIKLMGYEFNSQPMVTRENGPKICYFRGPDNVIIELFEEVN